MNLRPLTSIPDWTPEGVLPPLTDSNPTSADRSPYRVSLTDFITHFGINSQRLTILSGLLSYRALWHAAGITEGFQWIDGSYIENIEILENRTPADVDLVTFFRIPSGLTQAELINSAPLLFNPSQRDSLKTQFFYRSLLCTLKSPRNFLYRGQVTGTVYGHIAVITYGGIY
jgi:hypothetical protein